MMYKATNKDAKSRCDLQNYVYNKQLKYMPARFPRPPRARAVGRIAWGWLNVAGVPLPFDTTTFFFSTYVLSSAGYGTSQG